MSGTNVGDLLNAAGIIWGWFQGGFRPTGTDGSGKAVNSDNVNESSGKKEVR